MRGETFGMPAGSLHVESLVCPTLRLFLSLSSGHFVGPADDGPVLDDAALHVGHAAHDFHERVLVLEAERLAGADARGAAHMADVGLRVVPVARGRPPGDDSSDGVCAPADVAAQEHEGRPVAVHARGELHEGLVGLPLPHARPPVLRAADVERVVVPDASGLHRHPPVVSGTISVTRTS